MQGLEALIVVIPVEGAIRGVIMDGGSLQLWIGVTRGLSNNGFRPSCRNSSA